MPPHGGMAVWSPPPYLLVLVALLVLVSPAGALNFLDPHSVSEIAAPLPPPETTVAEIASAPVTARARSQQAVSPPPPTFSAAVDTTNDLPEAPASVLFPPLISKPQAGIIAHSPPPEKHPPVPALSEAKNDPLAAYDGGGEVDGRTREWVGETLDKDPLPELEVTPADEYPLLAAADEDLAAQKSQKDAAVWAGSGAEAADQSAEQGSAPADDEQPVDADVFRPAVTESWKKENLGQYVDDFADRAVQLAAASLKAEATKTAQSVVREEVERDFPDVVEPVKETAAVGVGSAGSGAGVVDVSSASGSAVAAASGSSAGGAPTNKFSTTGSGNIITPAELRTGSADGRFSSLPGSAVGSGVVVPAVATFSGSGGGSGVLGSAAAGSAGSTIAGSAGTTPVPELAPIVVVHDVPAAPVAPVEDPVKKSNKASLEDYLPQDLYPATTSNPVGSSGSATG